MNLKKSILKVMMLSLLMLFVSMPAFGQGVTTSSMRGTIIDNNGETLPGANVIATHVASGTQYGTAANVQGTFNIRGMRVGGPYRVTVTFVGYQEYSIDNIYLGLGDTYQLNAALTEDAVQLDGIDVVASGGVFDPGRVGTGTNISEEQLNIIPTIGRDLADFTRLTPQAYVENDDDDGPAISIAGQNNRYNAIYVDGAVSNDVFGLSAQGTNGGQTGSTPISIDAIEEFQINIAPYDVTQSGFTGGSINAITRSGTNQYEGSFYSYFRNEAFVGKTPGVLSDFTGDERKALPDFSNNRYGVRIGGPIIENKLFFFANVELLRSETPQPFESYVGTSSSRLDEIRSTLLSEVGYETGDFGDKVSSLDDNKFLIKLDWNINQGNKLSIRHSYSDSENTDAFQSRSDELNYGNNSEFFPNKTNSTALELNSVIGTQFANKLLIGYTTVEDDRAFTGSPFPTVEIRDGDGTIFIGSEPFSTANILEQDIFTITNNFNVFSGNHTMTFGTHLEFYDIGNLFIPQNFGDYEYNSVDDFLQSIRAINDTNIDPVAPRIFQRGYSLVDDIAGDGTSALGAFKALQVGFYAQDEWQVSDDFRLTYGVRVDFPKVTSDPNFADDALTSTIPAIEEHYDLNGATPGQTPDALPYISPRVGFNYDVNGDQKLQLRGGAGVFTGRVPFVWPGSMFLNNGTNSGFIFNFGGTLENGDPVPFIPDPQQQLTGSDFGQSDIPSGRLEIFEDGFRYPQVLRTSLALDKDLGNGLIGTIEGQFTKTLKNILVTNVNLNPDAVAMTDGPGSRPFYNGDIVIDPRYSAVHRVGNTSDGHSWDITASLMKRLDEALGQDSDMILSGSYTYGDAFAVNDGTSSQINTLWRSMEVSDNLPNALSSTRSDFSLGHRILASVTVRKEFLNNLATTVSLFYTGESGRPYNYTIDNSDALINAPGFRDFGLLYVPNNASELSWTGDAAASAAALDNFIESSDYLSERRGQFAQRNGSRLPFENIFDFKFSQELFAQLGNRRTKLEFTLDIFNIANLINKDWGLRYDKFTSSSNGGFELIEFQGFADADNGDFTPTYSLDFDPERTPTEDEFFKDQIKETGSYSSRWFMQMGFRYTF
ncbi:MAG: TonB-dependent receptor [Rhodothermales bacterium]